MMKIEKNAKDRLPIYEGHPNRGSQNRRDYSTRTITTHELKISLTLNEEESV